MKDEFNYWKDLAMVAVRHFYNSEHELQSTARDDDPSGTAGVIVSGLCGITEEELQCIRDKDADGAYAKYCEDNPPLHEYVVSYEMPPVTGTVRVKALSEEEAEEYVESNIMFDRVDIGMADEENMLEEPELDEWGTEGNATINGTDDDGEYEED